MRSNATILAVVLVVMAGCAADPAASPTPIPSTSATACLDTDCYALPERPSPPSLQAASFSQCHKISHTLEVGNEVWDPPYPSGVTPATTPGTPVHAAGLIYWNCRQALVVDSVEQDVRMFFFVGAIEPPTPAARNDSFSMYVFQAYTNNARLAAELQTRYGLDATVLEIGDAQRSALSGEPEPSDLYTIQIGEGTPFDYDIEGQLRLKQTTSVKSTDAFYFLDPSGALSGFRIAWEGFIGPSAPAPHGPRILTLTRTHT